VTEIDTGKQQLDEYKLILKVNNKVNEIKTEIEVLKGVINTILPKLATTDEIEVLIYNHKDKCRDERKKSSDKIKAIPIAASNGKINAKYMTGYITGIASAVAAVGYLLYEFISKTISG
jgi:hypothetical protein